MMMVEILNIQSAIYQLFVGDHVIPAIRQSNMCKLFSLYYNHLSCNYHESDQ